MKNTSYFTIKFLLFITGLLFTYPCHADLEVALANDTAKQSPRKKLTPALDYTYFEYVGKGYSYNGECSPSNWSLVVKWNDIENDIYKKLICTREEFFANYGEPLESDQGDLQQYVLTSNGQFYASEDPVGTIFTIHETSAEADNTGIYSLQWHMNSTEAQEIFLANPYMPISRAIKFESKDKSKWPDIFLIFKSGEDVSINVPKGTVRLDRTTLIDYFWYTHNSGEDGFDEIRAHTVTPDNNTSGNAEAIDITLSNVFYGYLANLGNLITVEFDNTANKEYATDKLYVHFEFDKSNNGKKFIGIDNNTYTITISEDGLTLSAYLKTVSDAQNIAKLVGEDCKTMKIEYQKTEYAKALLNYVSAQKLNNNAISATIALKAVNQCPKELTLDNNTFDVRFLRPVNATSADKEINNTTGTTIDMKDLVTFTDWREMWKGPNSKEGEYYNYYGIKSITIDGVEDNQVISSNAEIQTNLGQDEDRFVSLQSVTNNIDFTYNNGKLTLYNYDDINTDFTVRIPVIVEYLWGKIPAMAQLKISPTTQTGLSINVINFPDEAFRNWILENVSGADDAILTDEEIAQINKLNCSNKSISNLQGIEYFTAL